MEDHNMELFDALWETSRLVPYFPKGFDFGIDSYDPAVSEFVECLDFFQNDADMQEFMEGEIMSDIIAEGMERHMTIEKRFALFQSVSAAAKKAHSKDRQSFRVVIRALRDCSVPAFLIGLARNLYKAAIMRAADADFQYGDDVKQLVKQIAGAPDESLIHRAVETGDTFVNALRDMSDELSIEEYRHILPALYRMPKFSAAEMISDLAKDGIIEWDGRVSAIKESPVSPYLAEYLLHDGVCTDEDLFDRWCFIEGLVFLRDYRVIPLLRSELLAAVDEDERDECETFRLECAEYFVDLADRRAIPVFIEVLHRGKEFHYSDAFMSKFNEIGIQSSWWEEISSGMELLRQGEPVLVYKGQKPMDLVMAKEKSLADMMSAVGITEITMSQLNSFMAGTQSQWNNAYHEDLGWLRPVDMPDPEIKQALLERMYREMEKAGKSVERLPREQQVKKVNELMREFMLTPLADHGGDFPLSLIAKAEMASITSRGVKERYEKLYDSQKNALYLEAQEYFDRGDILAARLRLSALLQMDPEYPFGKALKKVLDKTDDGEAPPPQEQTPPPALRTDLLKPFFADHIYKVWPPLKDYVTREVASLRTAAATGPFTDDSPILFLEDYLLEIGQAMADDAPPSLSRDEIVASIEPALQRARFDYLTCVNFEFFDRKVFYFSPALVQALMETSVQVEGALLHLPFPSCAFVFQDPQIIQLFHKCFSDTDIVPEYDTPVGVFLGEVRKADHRVLLIEIARLSKDLRDYGLAKRELKIEDDKTLEDALRTVWEGPHDDQAISVGDEFFFDDIRLTFFRTILTCILYLSTSHPDVMKMNAPVVNLQASMDVLKSHRKKAKLQRRVDAMAATASSLPYIFVGRNYRFRLPSSDLSSVEPGKYRQLMKRFMVRGHYRSVAYGKGHLLRRGTWIEPYWKGPQDLDDYFDSKPYIVE